MCVIVTCGSVSEWVMVFECVSVCMDEHVFQCVLVSVGM